MHSSPPSAISSTSLSQLRNQAMKPPQRMGEGSESLGSPVGTMSILKEILREVKLQREDVNKLLRANASQATFSAPPISTSGSVYPSPHVRTIKPPYEYGG